MKSTKYINKRELPIVRNKVIATIITGKRKLYFFCKQAKPGKLDSLAN